MKMENLKISIVQADMVWENALANRRKYDDALADITESELIIFPEMFTTGFSMRPEMHYEPMNGPSVSWMQEVAQQKNAAVLGSLIVEENKQFFNRAVWVFPNGDLEIYDKRHLFTMGQEPEHYSPGRTKSIIHFKGWKICPLICYDLRFPVWARNTDDYDLLIYMANWPSSRHHVWKNLLVARAIENQCYCAGVNRCGTDGNGLNYRGNSALVSPKGMPHFLGEQEEIKSFDLSYSELHNFRMKFPVLNDRDSFQWAT